MTKFRFILVLLLNFFSVITIAQKPQFLESLNSTNYFNESYSNDKLNTFDIFLPKSNVPTPIVIYIHGGGFKQGDKTSAYKRQEDIEYFIDNQIAFATVNYRFMNSNDSIGVRKSLNDIQHAIQFILHQSKRYNIDKTKFALYGHSAGAGASLYFAFHDDFADKSSSSYLKESTKPICVGALDTQATYDVFRWKAFVPTLKLGAIFKRKYFYNYASSFYGYPNYKAFKPFKKDITKDLDMLSLIDASAPSTYIVNLSHKTETYDLDILHDASHAQELKKSLKKHGVEHYVYTHENIKEATKTVSEFLIDKLN